MSSSNVLPTIYIIYNAKSTLLGKFNYVYRKTTCPDPADNPACAACELTHGPSLRLSESQEWTKTKSRILHVNVVQVHIDERPATLAKWMKENGILAPAVVAQLSGNSADQFKQLMTLEDLARVRHDHEKFLELLRDRSRDAGIPGMEVANES